MTKRSPQQQEALRRQGLKAHAAYMEKVGYFQDRADCLESGLSAGLSTSAALADGGWVNVEAANRAYNRHRRPRPAALRDAYNTWIRDRNARRRCSR